MQHAGIATLACSFGLPRWLTGTGAGNDAAEDDAGTADDTGTAGDDTEEDEARRGSAASVRNR